MYAPGSYVYCQTFFLFNYLCHTLTTDQANNFITSCNLRWSNTHWTHQLLSTEAPEIYDGSSGKVPLFAETYSGAALFVVSDLHSRAFVLNRPTLNRGLHL